ncbi:MAG TPA: hypothetical protein VKP04_01960 [Ktedonobacteraceae bacterium]|nr:hypothetical protein [Ktedonobacteraceae bacterium]
MQTDPDVNKDSKVPWKGMIHKGYIDEDFLYATLLSKQLLPFGIGKLHLVALPEGAVFERFSDEGNWPIIWI